jgi:hypothetical protein
VFVRTEAQLLAQTGQSLYWRGLLEAKPQGHTIPPYIPLGVELEDQPMEGEEKEEEEEEEECFVCRDNSDGLPSIDLCVNGHKVHDACAMGLFSSWLTETGAMHRGLLDITLRIQEFPAHTRSVGRCPVCQDNQFLAHHRVFDLFLELHAKFKEQRSIFTGGDPMDPSGFRSAAERTAAEPVLYIELTAEEELERAIQEAEEQADQVNLCQEDEESEYTASSSVGSVESELHDHRHHEQPYDGQQEQGLAHRVYHRIVAPRPAPPDSPPPPPFATARLTDAEWERYYNF